ncbi:MAG: HAMP domain-containing histidine kinase [Alphaproteobacteria bacterium]|nr:HAMP domain-containing histidine kinase [Alphaproteobacteria bacterium]
MKLHSLRLRLVVAATIALAVAMVAAGFLLVGLFERHVTRHYDEELQSYLRQLAGAVEFTADGKVTLDDRLQDARFGEPLSGLYWQIEEDKTGFILTSRSLWDTRIPLPKDPLGDGQVDSHVLPGPAGQMLRIQERQIVFDLPSGSRALRMATAMNVADIQAASHAFARDLWPSIVTVGLLLLAATWFYIGVGLRPLDSIRRSLQAVRTGTARRLEGDFPSELMPLVQEANGLLAAQDETLTRARARAADLAHGLKTPLAVLQSDADRLRERGQPEIADEIGELVGQMRRHVDRELARVRLRAAGPKSTAVTPVIARLAAFFQRTPRGKDLTWNIGTDGELAVAADAEDLTEMLGNLLDNACKWAASSVAVSVQAVDGVVCITVADDGPGVPQDSLPSLTGRGVRLDEETPGTGLGLAIAQDIAEACGGSLTFANSVSSGGGFSATVHLPLQKKSASHA